MYFTADQIFSGENLSIGPGERWAEFASGYSAGQLQTLGIITAREFRSQTLRDTDNDLSEVDETFITEVAANFADACAPPLKGQKRARFIGGMFVEFGGAIDYKLGAAA
jgi:hypothetical protein